ncbi:hypothetical protein Lalb_Chr18g0057481 [Lupinus albus]|uniref:Uncharacterized protein n=1 Tax=Lupinus albus TaxID=3870 RepID=A0A6A4NVQ9_LUPAL|nr:hypothetical protein Lalb_Chr18g0057481 [Lupinus albus]
MISEMMCLPGSLNAMYYFLCLEKISLNHFKYLDTIYLGRQCTQ